MARLAMFFLACLLALPEAVHAIQLRWADGSTDLTFSERTYAVLVVQADSAEVVLPSQWTLQWLADSAGVNLVARDSLAACFADTAQASSYDPPSTPADSAAHLITAHFCSGGSSATIAYFVLVQPDGSKGRMKVVALDPTDTTQVIESNQATYNGGIDGDYAPVLLSAMSEHSTALLQLNVVGAGLDSVTEVSVGSNDHLWNVPLTITSRNGSRLSATAEVAASLPSATVLATTASGAGSETALAADPITTAEVVEASSDTILFADPNPSVYPKDFAFFYNSVPIGTGGARKGLFHLIYIRNRAGQDSILAHAWCDTLGAPWTVDTLAFRPSGSGWDAKKCWAPSLQQVGDRTYMFYTGVDNGGNQSIGYAYTDSFFTTNIPWHRLSQPVYQAQNTGWASTAGLSNQIQFRDPFIMPDPDVGNYPGRFLLFNTGQDRNYTAYMTIGVARNSPGTFNSWLDGGHYTMTDFAHDGVTRAESPLVVRDSLTGAWRMFIANGNYDPQGDSSTVFHTGVAGDSVTDLNPSNWPNKDWLFYYAGEDNNLVGWQAAEHLQIGGVHFFAAYVGPAGIGITRMHWDPLAHKFFFVHPTNTSVGNSSPPGRVQFSLRGWRPGATGVTFVVESDSFIVPKLVLYDLMGRRVRDLLKGQRISGRREVYWDGRDQEGNWVPSGMLFARLSGAGRPAVLRVPVIH